MPRLLGLTSFNGGKAGREIFLKFQPTKPLTFKHKNNTNWTAMYKTSIGRQANTELKWSEIGGVILQLTMVNYMPLTYIFEVGNIASINLQSKYSFSRQLL